MFGPLIIAFLDIEKRKHLKFANFELLQENL